MKIQFVLLATVMVSSVALAQSKSSVTIRGGLSSASIKGDAVQSLDNLLDYTNGMIRKSSNTGFFAGASVSIPLNEMFSIEPGVSYTQKGTELKGELGIKNLEFLGANAKAKLTSHYIDLPLVLKANINGFQIFAGPQVSYLAKADLKTTAGVLGFNLFGNTMDATEQINRWDACITGGIGYQFANGFNVSASYDHGLTKIDANKNMDAYTRSFKVGVGFRF
ncbi:MAG TPA: porin family protein [Chitinophagaceae bacterium]|nr:porin family protein [Chitinophagaceae bacterium]